jgi:hypothetical protein
MYKHELIKNVEEKELESAYGGFEQELNGLYKQIAHSDEVSYQIEMIL